MTIKNTSGFTVSQLQDIHSKDNGEPLFSLSDILCDYKRKGSDITSVLVRQSLIEKLQKVQERLTLHDSTMQLLVIEGYRSPSYQEQYFLKELLFQYQKDPSRDFEELVETTHKFVSLPTLTGYPTGGAIDLTIMYGDKELNMGGTIEDFMTPENFPTYSTHISPEELENRLLLHDLMLKEGFAPCYKKWWHFSYGDLEWAAFYNLPESLYSPVFFDLH
jgi:D-alanyl-D-alanine dipeptidase